MFRVNIKSSLLHTVTLVAAMCLLPEAYGQARQEYRVEHQFRLRPGGNVVPQVRRKHFHHVWVDERRPDCTDVKVEPSLADQPLGFHSLGRNNLRSRGRINNRGRGGGPVTVNWVDEVVPPAGFAAQNFETEISAACSSNAQAASRIRIDPFAAGTRVSGLIRSYGFAEAIRPPPRRTTAYSFSSTAVEARGGRLLRNGNIRWRTVVRDRVYGRAKRRRQRDPIEFRVQDLVTGDVVEGTLLDFVIDMYANPNDPEGLDGSVGPGSFIWDDDLVTITADQVDFAIEIPGDYTDLAGTLHLHISNGEVTTADATGIFAGLLPAVGTQTPLQFPLPSEVEFDYDLGDFGGHELEVEIDFDGNGEAEVELAGPCQADFNDDGVVGAADLAVTLGNWGPCDNETCDADLNDDLIVNATDLAMLLGEWGACSECADDSECSDGDTCTFDVCVEGLCEYIDGAPCCGDGIVDEFEECDPPDGELCDESCLTIDPPPCSCGCDLNCDGITTDEELLECEDLCGTGGICGDGVVGEGEQCDPPDGVTCDADCQIITGACDYPDIRTIVADADLDPPDIQQNYDAINATLHLFGGMTFEAFFFEPLDVLSSVALERVETLETCAGVPIDAAMVAAALEQIGAVGTGLGLVEVVSSPPGELEEIKAAIDQLRMQGIGFPPVATADSDVALILDSVVTLVDEAGVLEYGDYFFKDDSEVTEAQLAAITQANDEGGILDFQVIDVENMTLKRTVRNNHCCERGGCDPLDRCNAREGKWCSLPHVGDHNDCGLCSIGSKKCS